MTCHDHWGHGGPLGRHALQNAIVVLLLWHFTVAFVAELCRLLVPW